MTYPAVWLIAFFAMQAAYVVNVFVLLGAESALEYAVIHVTPSAGAAWLTREHCMQAARLNDFWRQSEKE